MVNKKTTGLPSVEGKGKKKFQWTKQKIVAASIIGAALLSAIIFVVIVLSMNLGPIRPIESTEEEARVVGSVGEYEVRFEELRYITLLHKASLDESVGAYDSLDAEGKAQYEAELERLVLEDLKNNYVVLALCDEYGIKTDTPYVNDQVQKQIESLIEADEVNSGFNGDKDAYVSWLAENALTDSFLRLMYKVNYLENELLEHFVENKIDVAYDAENKAEFSQYVLSSGYWARTIHVYYPYEHPWTDPGNVPAEILAVDGDYIHKVIEEYDAESAVRDAYATVTAAKNDDERYSKICSAIGRTPVTELAVSGTGFYFTYGQMGDEYEELAFALSPYGVSEIFDYGDGYCFMMRLPLEEDYVKKNAGALLEQYQYAALKKREDDVREKLTFLPNEYFESLVLVEIE